MMNEIEERNKILTVLCQYLLFERKQETELQMAFATLAQERHNTTCSKGKSKNSGDGSDISECSKEICRMAYNVLIETRQSAVEINEFTVLRVADTVLKVKKTGSSLRAWLETKPQIEQPKLIIPN